MKLGLTFQIYDIIFYQKIDVHNMKNVLPLIARSLTLEIFTHGLKDLWL